MGSAHGRPIGENSSPLLADEHANFTTITPDGHGLSSLEVRSRLLRFGYNELEAKKLPTLVRLCQKLWGPVPWLIEIAAIVSASMGSLKDLSLLVALLMVNGLIAFVEESHAADAIEALRASLAPQARVLREGQWRVVDTRELVPDDIIQLRQGDVAPADVLLGGGEPIEVDQSSLTGETKPVSKCESEIVYQGSVICRGELPAVVTATGVHSFFGKAAVLYSSGTPSEGSGHFQRVFIFVSRTLFAVALALVSIMFFVLLFDPSHHERTLQERSVIAPAIQLCLVLLVTVAPVPMQLIAITTMAVGSRSLAKKRALVARLSAIEELAGMSILCAEKSKTLTRAQLALGEPFLLSHTSMERLILHAALTCKQDGEQEPLDKVLSEAPALQAAPEQISAFEVLKLLPCDAARKRAEATVRAPDGETFSVSTGSPMAVAALASDTDIRERVAEAVDLYASRGYRTLGVARTTKEEEETRWELLGLLSLYEPPREGVAQSLAAVHSLRVDVKMVTGEHIAIARETSRLLGLHTNIMKADDVTMRERLTDVSFLSQTLDHVENADGFAEVLPEHKLSIVDMLQARGHAVGITGDGVSDAPALKLADVGFAVQGATDAARASADVVLLTPGLSVIVDAIGEARIIFQRMRGYCMYQIATSTHFLAFFFFAIITLHLDLPVFAFCLLLLLNNGIIMTVPYDTVRPDMQPARWDLPRTCGVAIVLGLVGVASTFMLLYLARPSEPSRPALLHHLNLPELADAQLQSLVYLQLSASGQATIFITRTRGAFVTERPALRQFVAFAVAQMISTLIIVYASSELSPMIGLGVDCSGGPPGAPDWDHLAQVNDCTLSANNTGACALSKMCVERRSTGWAYAGLVWAYCFGWMCIQDLAKHAVYALLDASDAEARATRQQKIDNKQLLARHSRGSSVSPSRLTSEKRSTNRSTGFRSSWSEGGVGQAQLVGSDAMLEPSASSHSSRMRHLPDLVSALEARVRELEAQLALSRTTSSAAGKAPAHD